MAHRPAPPPEPEDERRTGLIWVAIIVALLLVIGIGVVLFVKLGSDDGPGAPQKVAVPAVIGHQIQPAVAQFQNVGLKLRPNPNGEVTNDACDDGSTPDNDTIKVVCHLTDMNNELVAVGDTDRRRVDRLLPVLRAGDRRRPVRRRAASTPTRSSSCRRRA